ncbi:hypothetical protein [Nannocystis bainbridge]|uniref:PH domain-containing protein n=1 Tax=Nannocystis bainbridge TaxID=2995303 RepID=A0ABT5EBP5_9BACT|nr:hypothetical protein [Nannocystis bainbridge]MDC0723282.1 hypothetical protein [Nannocystis bainbridge]
MADESHALVPTEGSRLPDPYEQRYMAGEGTVLYRHKYSAPWQLHLIFVLTITAVFGAAVAAGGLVGGAIGMAVGAPLFGLMWILFSVLRVTVSEGHVNVQYGLFGPKIPISGIEQAELVQYNWRRFGGWGIKRSLAGEWIYNMPGDGGRAVRIVWRDARGKRHVTHVGSPRADELLQQIGRARGALPAGASPAALEPGDP